MTDKVAHYQDLLKEAVRKVRDLKGQLEAAQRTSNEPIAILGMGCRFPSAADAPAQFWQLLQAGIDTIDEMPAHRRPAQTDERETHQGVPLYRGGFLRQVDQFDARFFGIAPTEAHCLDPQQRLLLETSWEALEQAAIAPGGLTNSATGVFCGISGSEYDTVLRSSAQAGSLYRSTGTDSSTAAGRIAYTLGLTGPAIAVDTACSSSLVAVYLACQSLRERACDLALAGGVGIILSADTTRMFADAGMLSPDSTCKTFDAGANGFVRGEGCGVLVLKRLSDALAAGDPVLAVIRGAAVNQNGRSAGLTAPNVLSQQAVIRQALQQAQLTPDQISYIEAFGTGTALGDPIEAEALSAVFASSAEPIWLGSVKTNLGHLEAAAGMAGLIKTVLCLQHQRIPPNLHFHTPNPHIDWKNLPIHLPTAPVAWETTATRPSRIAGVSSFGYSGTNCHVILEQAPARSEPAASPAEQPSCAILPLSAKQPAALAALIARYHAWLADSTVQKDLTLDDLCYTAQVGRDHFAYRASFAGRTREEMLTQLAAWDGATASQIQQRPTVGFLFTGQGSQYARMGQQLYQTQPVYRATLDACDTLLRSELDGFSILEVIQEEPAERIHQTTCTQPALFVLEYALATLWQAWGVKPAVLIGHSVGELAAACVAGVFSLADGLRLIAARARLMGALPADGHMVSCLADEATIRQVAESITYHPPQIPLVSNVTGQLADETISTPDYWVRHARVAVRFADGIQTVYAQGATCLLEIGPKPVLLGLARQADGPENISYLPGLRAGRDDWQMLLNSLGQLYTRGVVIDWTAFNQPYQRQKVALPTYPFQRERYWISEQQLSGGASSAAQCALIQQSQQAGDVDATIALLDTQDQLSTTERNILHTLLQYLVVNQQPGNEPQTSDRITQAAPEMRCAVLKDLIKAEVEQVLQLMPEDHQPFPELGLDSLMAVELRNRLHTITGLELPAGVVFDHPTVQQLAWFILREMGLPVKQAAIAETDQQDQLLDRLQDALAAPCCPELQLGDWHIRPAVLADVARLSELEQAAYGWIGEEAVASPELITERIDRLNSGDHAWFWVMEKSEQVVAWQILQPTQVDPDAYRSWAEATDDGTLASTFDPQGRYVYLVAAGSDQQLLTVSSHLLTLQTLMLFREMGHDCLFYCSAMPGYAQHYAETGQSPEDYIAITDQAGIPKDEFIALSVYGWPVKPSFRVLRDGYPPDRDSCGHGVSVVFQLTDFDTAIADVCQQVIRHARLLDLATDTNARELS
ncbi:MAG: beta-ketoacyl synthase N-terminal-like domain-containing protein [Pseudomonadota bacterium]